MTDVFLDSVGLIALWDRSDQCHAAASAAYREILAQGRRLITTNLVLIETGNASIRRPYRRLVDALRRAFTDEGLVIDPTPNEIEKAWSNHDRGAPGEAGIVDQVLFLVMRRLKITDVFTNDRYFAVTGFRTLF